MATTVPPRVLRESRDIFMPPGRVLRTTRDSMLEGLGSKASPAATTAEPLKSLSVAEISGVAGISARSGLLVGMKVASVRLDSFRYALATRRTSASVTACDAVAHQEHEAPIALGEVLAEIERDGLGIVHFQLDVLQQCGS